MARKAQLDVNPIDVARVLDTYAQATEVERETGRIWYPSMQEYCVALAMAYNVTVEQATAIVAVLSQSTSMEANIGNAEWFLAHRSFDSAHKPFYSAMADKCYKILSDYMNPARHAAGPKISAFYRNLLGDASIVCADRHAIYMATGSPAGEGKNTQGATPARVAYSQRVITHAASILGISPSACQAITWVVWRRLHPHFSNVGDQGGLRFIAHRVPLAA